MNGTGKREERNQFVAGWHHIENRYAPQGSHKATPGKYTEKGMAIVDPSASGHRIFYRLLLLPHVWDPDRFPGL